MWFIWLEKNNCAFKGSNKHYVAVTDSIFSKVGFWAVKCKEFHGYDLDSIMWWNVVM